MQEVKAFEIINPQAQSPLILTCEHATAKIPENYHNLGLADELLDTHIARDKGIDEQLVQCGRTVNQDIVK